MEYFVVPAQKVPPLQHFRKTEKEVIGGLCSLANIPLTPETQRDQERRIRREIANSNERRRMQSINAGFQSLKTLIPHTDGEKLSKAAILQQTAEYIFSLEQEKTRLLQQNAQLKRFIQEFSGSSPKRRRAEDKDEGIGSPDIWEDEKAEDLRREMIELRQQLDKERSVRMMLEEQVCPAGLEATRGTFSGQCASKQMPLWADRARAGSQRALLCPSVPCPLGRVTGSLFGWLIGTLFGGTLVPGEVEGDCPTGAAPAAGTGEAPVPRSTWAAELWQRTAPASPPSGLCKQGHGRQEARALPQPSPADSLREGGVSWVMKTKWGYPDKMAVPKSPEELSSHLVGPEASLVASAPSTDTHF
uniref:Transcription factor AP-4 n=1 Tax=Laticauda laticaudata TaxID=8630 RepID=A0A8C5SBV5_LATLA